MIDIRHLNKSYGQRQVLDDFNYYFSTDRIYSLVGASGIGKSTLLNMIARLEPVDSGQIIMNGQSIEHIPLVHYYRDYLGYLFQNHGLIDNEFVSANLDLGLVGRSVSKRERQDLKTAALQEVGLSQMYLTQPVYQLSGGEAQRVAMAKLILKQPRIVLADEPTGSLDPDNAKNILELLLAMRSPERTIIIATHDPMIWSATDEMVHLT